jgi:hypothetical protein
MSSLSFPRVCGVIEDLRALQPRADRVDTRLQSCIGGGGQEHAATYRRVEDDFQQSKTGLRNHSKGSSVSFNAIDLPALRLEDYFIDPLESRLVVSPLLELRR